MKIIGEKINGTRKRVGQAITDRDAEFIKNLAIKQSEAGADWLDVNAGTHPDHEPDDLIWLVEAIQSVVDTPLCLDSANPEALMAVMRAVHQTPMINSISGEPDRLGDILPLVVENNCPTIVLAMDNTGIPETSEKRLDVIREVVKTTREHGISDDRLYLDPLAMTIATNTESGIIALDTIRAFRSEFPEAHISIGLSNISFGLPARSYINRTFMTLALAAGLDCAIIDPMDTELMAAKTTAQLILGQDEYCQDYTHAYRAGLFGEKK